MWLKRIIVLIFLLKEIGTLNVYNNCECGRSKNPLKSRIIGGLETEPHNYPWTVGIVDIFEFVYCGGSIISDKHVLSAAHCPYYRTFPFAVKMVVGMHDNVLKDGVAHPVEVIYYHPKFKPYKNYDDYDMAIYEVSQPFLFSDTVKPICLPHAVTDHTGKKATVVGWGRTLEDVSTPPRFLQETSVKVLSQRICGAEMGDVFNPDSMMCAFSKRTDACQGDSGGALFMETSFNRYEQIGVVSFGVGCAQDMPGIYQRVDKAMYWIRKVLSQNHTGICMDPDRAKTPTRRYCPEHPFELYKSC